MRFKIVLLIVLILSIISKQVWATTDYVQSVSCPAGNCNIGYTNCEDVTYCRVCPQSTPCPAAYANSHYEDNDTTVCSMISGCSCSVNCANGGGPGTCSLSGDCHYHCNANYQWTGSACLLVAGQACTNGDECASDICVAGYCRSACDSYNGQQCSVTTANWNSYGICAKQNYDNIWYCYTTAALSSGTYYECCDSTAPNCCYNGGCTFTTPCDSNTAGGFGASGVCGSTSASTCCGDYGGDSDNVNAPDTCGTETGVCSGSSRSGWYCDSVADGSWSPGNQRCDDDTGCVLCTAYKTDTDNNNCEQGCGASSSCDESYSYSSCAGTSGYCDASCAFSNAFDTDSNACNCLSGTGTCGNGESNCWAASATGTGSKCCQTGDTFCANPAAGTYETCVSGTYRTSEDTYEDVCECGLNGLTTDDPCSADEAGCWAATGESGNHCCRQASDNWCDGTGGGSTGACDAGNYRTAAEDESYQEPCQCLGGYSATSTCSAGQASCWMATPSTCCDSTDNTCNGVAGGCNSGTYRTDDENYQVPCQCAGSHTATSTCASGETSCWMSNGPSANKCCDSTDQTCDSTNGACDSGAYRTAAEHESYQEACQCVGGYTASSTCSAGQTSCWMSTASTCCDSTDNACNGATSWVGCIGGTYNTSTDLSQYLCESCNASAAYYNTTTAPKYESGTPSCCGDDASEYRVNRVCAAGVCTSDATDWGCCASTSKCAYDGTCRSNGYTADVNSDGYLEKCNAANNQWVDGDAPKYSNNNTNATSIVTGEPVLIYANWTDNLDLNYSWLWTNETSGNGKNYTTNYGSPMDINLTAGQTWSNFTWDNNTFASGVVAWKIYANDSGNNENVTSQGYFTVYVPDAAFAIAMPTDFTFTSITATSEGAATQTAPNNISFNFTTVPEYWIEPCAGGSCSGSYKQNGANHPIYYVNVTGNVPIKIGIKLNATLTTGLQLGANASCSGTYNSCQSTLQSIGNTYVSLVDDLGVSSYANITLYANLTSTSLTPGEKVYEVLINSTAKSYT